MIWPKVLLAAVLVCSPSKLNQQLPRLAQPAGGRVGVSMMIVETGETVRWHATERFPMQSVYKLPIAMAVLKRVDEGKLQLDLKFKLSVEQLTPGNLHSPIREKYPHAGVELTLRELLRAAIVDSDSTASDMLLELVPPAQVTNYLHWLKIADLVVLNTERELSQDQQAQYRNFATPDALVQLLSALHRGAALSTDSRALLLGWMTETQTGIRRLRGSLPPGTLVADKTGTSGTRKGLTAATNDVGLITLPDGRHLAIAVFVSDSRAPQKVREGVIAKIARAAWDCWAR